MVTTEKLPLATSNTRCNQIYKQTNKQTLWPESARELYRPSDSCLSAKLVPTFVDREVSRCQRGGSPTAVI
jgi:hypothetical protein